MIPFCESIVWHGQLFAIRMDGRIFMMEPHADYGVLTRALTGVEPEYQAPCRALRALLEARKQ